MEKGIDLEAPCPCAAISTIAGCAPYRLVGTAPKLTSVQTLPRALCEEDLSKPAIFRISPYQDRGVHTT